MSDAGIDLAEKVSSLSEHWSPKVVARLNDYEIEVVKVDGQFVWHAHDDTDELFLVLRCELTIQLRDGNVTLRHGQLFVVPRGVERCPVADGEVHAMLIEPVGVVNTGTAGGPRTAGYETHWHSSRHAPAQPAPVEGLHRGTKELELPRFRALP